MKTRLALLAVLAVLGGRVAADDAAKLTTLLAPALERGGKLILRDGVADASGATGAVGLSERLTTFFGLNPGGSGLHFLSEDTMRALLSRCGFSVQSCEPSGGANRLWRCTAAIAADTPTETPSTTR